MNSLFDLIPLADPADAPLDLGPHVAPRFIVVGAPEWGAQIALVDSAVKSFENSAEQAIGIVPVGTAGELLWSRLPLELAGLAAQPTRTALFIFRPEHLESHASRPFWSTVLELSPSSATIRDAIHARAFQPMLPALSPGEAEPPGWLNAAIDRYSPAAVTSPEDAVALRAGLYQLHDALERSHSLAQSVQGAGTNGAGDYWHALMHRREPDYGNSKYWFRSVGSHPAFAELGILAAQILANCPDPQAAEWRERLCADGWDPLAFVDLCRSCATNESTPLARAAREIQWLEMLLLLEQTYRDATR